MLKMPNKKSTIIATAVVLLLLVAGVVFALNNQNAEKEEQNQNTNTKKKISQPVNIIPVSERPYLQLVPSSDGHHITIKVLELKKDAEMMDYEMEYQTGSMLQGFGNQLAISEGKAEEKKLLGSQSAGGAITYHEDIKGGTLLAQFEGGSEPYAVKSSWRYFTNTDQETSFSSQDSKFEISNSSLSKVKHLIIYNVPGFPAELEKELLSDPYALTADSSLLSISSNFEVAIKSSQEDVVIMAFSDEEWQELETTLVDGYAKASGPYAELYILVKK